MLGPRAARVQLGPFLLTAAVCAATLLLGWWLKQRCLLDGQWQGGERFTGACYTDVHALWRGRELHSGGIPYLDLRIEYPVLTGAQMWLAAAAARLIGAQDSSAFLAITAAMNAGWALVILAWLRRLGLGVPRLVWWAAAPPLALYAAHNWDLLPLMLLVVAIGLHAEERDCAAGVALGLGAAAKLFPALLVPLVVAIRVSQGRARDAARHLGCAAAAWLAVNVPVALAAPEAWWEFYRFSAARGPTLASMWRVVDQTLGTPLSSGPRDLLAAALFLVGAAVIAALGWRRHAGRQWVLIAPVLAWFILTNKVYSPQFDLWLVPLLALALPSFAPFAAFVAADLAVYWAEFSHLDRLDGAVDGLGYPVLAVLVVVRAVVLLWVIAAVLRGPPPVQSPTMNAYTSP